MADSGFVITQDGQTIEKDTLEKLDYNVDWSRWLNKVSDTISLSEWTVPAGIDQATPAPSESGGITTLFLEGGGAVGTKYLIRNKITTNGGRIAVRSFTIIMAQR